MPPTFDNVQLNWSKWSRSTEHCVSSILSEALRAVIEYAADMDSDPGLKKDVDERFDENADTS